MWTTYLFLVMKIAAFILLAAAGCSAHPAPHYLVAMGSLPLAEQEEVATAIVEWQTACQAHGLSFALTSECGATSHCMQFSTSADLGTAPNGTVSGRTSYSGGETDSATVALLPSGVTQQAVTHEVGHAMGLHHTGPGTIMCADWTCASPTITPADVEQFAELH